MLIAQLVVPYAELDMPDELHLWLKSKRRDHRNETRRGDFHFLSLAKIKAFFYRLGRKEKRDIISRSVVTEGRGEAFFDRIGHAHQRRRILWGKRKSKPKFFQGLAIF